MQSDFSSKTDPEYLWRRFPDYTVFRHSDNEKWFGLVMGIKKRSLGMNGSVPFDDICRWLEESYLTTASKEKKQKLRPPKEWIVPANPKYYDIEQAFDMAFLQSGDREVFRIL